jgi:hypothetical protein
VFHPSVETEVVEAAQEVRRLDTDLLRGHRTGLGQVFVQVFRFFRARLNPSVLHTPFIYLFIHSFVNSFVH